MADARLEREPEITEALIVRRDLELAERDVAQPGVATSTKNVYVGQAHARLGVHLGNGFRGDGRAGVPNERRSGISSSSQKQAAILAPGRTTRSISRPPRAGRQRG